MTDKTLDDYFEYFGRVRRCPTIPWDIDEEELNQLETEIDKLQEDKNKEDDKVHVFFYLEAISTKTKDRFGEKYVVISTVREEDYRGRYSSTRYHLTLTYLYLGQGLVEILELNGKKQLKKLKERIRRDNARRYKTSLGKVIRREIGLDRRSIEELRGIGVDVTVLTHDKRGLPKPLIYPTDFELKESTFLEKGNYVAGYNNVFRLSPKFPFIRIYSFGYPVYIQQPGS